MILQGLRHFPSPTKLKKVSQLDSYLGIDVEIKPLKSRASKKPFYLSHKVMQFGER